MVLLVIVMVLDAVLVVEQTVGPAEKKVVL